MMQGRRWLRAFALLLLLSFQSQAMAEEVVFILGRDEPGQLAFYGPATTYYRHALPDARLVTTARSLSEAREYLARNRGAGPWTRIVLVAHGSPWTGLEVPLFAGGPQASLDAVVEAVASGEFPSLAEGLVAPQARLQIESCALAQRPDYLAAVQRLLLGERIVAARIPDAPDGFVAFIAGEGMQATRMVLPVATSILRGGSDQSLRRRLAREHRRLAGVLSEPAPRYSGYPIRVEARLPVSLRRASADARRWAGSDPAVRRRLAGLAIPLEALRWRVQGSDNGEFVLLGDGLAVLARKPAPGENGPRD